VVDLDQINAGVALAIAIAFNSVGLAGLYYGLKADNAKQAADTEKSIAKLGSDFAIAMLTERTERVATQATVKVDIEKLITLLEADVKEVTHRVTVLESGQDEWTKALRQRTHDLANEFQKLVLEIDRLKRPKAYAEAEQP
jgi:hypothetical protein